MGEDPYLVSRMGVAYVNGAQGQGTDGMPLAKYLKTAAVAKHFALNNVETARQSISSQVDDATIRNYYMPNFRALTEEAHVAGLMTSYNSINGTPSAHNTYTSNLLLRRTFGFDGFINSDCGAVSTAYKLPTTGSMSGGRDWVPPGWSRGSEIGTRVFWGNVQLYRTTWITPGGVEITSSAGAEATSVRSGTIINCGDTEFNYAQEAIDAGVLNEGMIEEGLLRAFTARMKTGEFDSTDGQTYTQLTKDVIESDEHIALAKSNAEQALVLLKNDSVPSLGAPVLPLNASATKKVVILGDMAQSLQLGGYSNTATASNSTTIVEGITEALAAVGTVTVISDEAGASASGADDIALSDEAKAAIPDADLVLVVVGASSGEGSDRSSVAMPGNYNALVTAAAAYGNPNTVLYVVSPGAVGLGDVKDEVTSILWSAPNGQQQGAALAAVLFGDVNPSGRLPITWYEDDSQLPDISNYYLTPGETNGLGRTHMYFTGTPTYAFGYGLSYTTFSYGDVAISPTSAAVDGNVEASVTVTNTGSRAGATVVQLYAKYPQAGSLALPRSRLLRFQKTSELAPGQSEVVTFSFPVSDLKMFDSLQHKQVVYNGNYIISVATSAATAIQSQSLLVTGSLTPKVHLVTVDPGQVVFNVGDTLDLTGENPWLADDTVQDQSSQPGRDLTQRGDGIIVAANDDDTFRNLSGARITYASNRPEVASVDANGVVTAKSAGAATISVTVDGVVGTAVIAVK
jgi:beta-glucosidase-like glycosyl hydrolase